MISSMSVWIVIMIMHFYVRPYRSKFMDRLDDILLVLMLSIFIACAHFKLDQDNTSTVIQKADIDNFTYFVIGTMIGSAIFLAFFVGREVCLSDSCTLCRLRGVARAMLSSCSVRCRFSMGLTT